MQDDRRTHGQEPDSIIVGEPRTQRRVWIVWLAVLGGIVLLMLFKERRESPADTISQYQFEQLVDNGQIVKATVNYDPQNPALNEVMGKYYKTEGDSKSEVPFRARVRLSDALERKLFSMPQFQPRQPNTMLLSIAASVLPFLVIAALIWFFFIRQIRKATRSSPSAAEVNARALEQQKRFDGILDKWEEQARRMDAVLEKIEKR
jgi:ATP-dependent Zn protease